MDRPLSGEGLRRFNSWKFEKEADKWNPAVVWDKLQEFFDRWASFFAVLVCETEVLLIIFTQPLRSGRMWHKVNF